MSTVVFLSSTIRDLDSHRKAVREAVNKLDGYECRGIEDFGARDDSPESFCRKAVAEADVLVGILGQLYGSCPPDSILSYTEIEYDEAVERNIPRLMFVTPSDFPVTANLIESDDKRSLQDKFRARVDADRVRDTFGTPQELATAVLPALHNLASEEVGESPSTRDEPTPYDPLVEARLRPVREGIDEDARLVMSTPISADRVAKFQQRLVEVRANDVMRRLMIAAGQYGSSDVYEAGQRYGIRHPARKGPFVAEANWMSLEDDQYHQSMEDHQLQRFTDALVAGSSVQATISSPGALKAFVEESKSKLADAGAAADLVVVDARLPTEFDVELGHLAEYVSPRYVHGDDLSDRLHLSVAGMPVLRVYRSTPPRQIVFVVDLRRSVRLTQLLPLPFGDAMTAVEIETISFPRAVELLEKNPRMFMYRDAHALSREERVAELLQSVIIGVTEASRWDVLQDQPAITAAQIVLDGAD